MFFDVQQNDSLYISLSNQNCVITKFNLKEDKRNY